MPSASQCSAAPPQNCLASRRDTRRAPFMTNWIETYRGTVPPWECDVTEHFTIAYYFARLEEAEPNLADAFGLSKRLHGGGFARRLDVRFARELRAGSSFQVEGAVLGLDEGLRLGHRFVDSANGETVTWIDERWDLANAPLSGEERGALDGRLATWEGPVAEIRAEPKSTEGFIPTARGRIRPADLDSAGHFGLAAIVHRFTDACIQAGSAIGMDSEYMEKSRRGFSTLARAADRGRARARRPVSRRDRCRASRQFLAAPRPCHD